MGTGTVPNDRRDGVDRASPTEVNKPCCGCCGGRSTVSDNNARSGTVPTSVRTADTDASNPHRGPNFAGERYAEANA